MHSVLVPHVRTASRVSVLAFSCLIAFALVAPAQQPPAEQQSSPDPGTSQEAAQPLAAESIKANAVRAGAMSGGFFHASVAALAINDPKLLASRIERSGDDYLVHFADGKRTQRVTAAEVEAVRSSGYDRSDDPWVAALYRGYEMRVLYDAIQFAIGRVSFSPAIKAKAAQMMDQNVWLVKAYERAIRATISPTGDLKEEEVRAAVREELKSSKETEDAKRSAENMLLSTDMFRDTAKAVKENGELFGAYKAAGNTMLPDRIVEAFAGKPQGLEKPTGRLVNSALKNVRDSKRAAVVSTPDLPLNKLARRPAGPLPWYAPLHAYTLVDSSAAAATLRNPTAEGAKATIKVPVATFSSVFGHITVQQ